MAEQRKRSFLVVSITYLSPLSSFTRISIILCLLLLLLRSIILIFCYKIPYIEFTLITLNKVQLKGSSAILFITRVFEHVFSLAFSVIVVAAATDGRVLSKLGNPHFNVCDGSVTQNSFWQTGTKTKTYSV